jgi:hypothetical protein
VGEGRGCGNGEGLDWGAERSFDVDIVLVQALTDDGGLRERGVGRAAGR